VSSWATARLYHLAWCQLSAARFYRTGMVSSWA